MCELCVQEDLYPETQADIPAITAEEWWTQRKNADPVLMSMADGGGSSAQSEELVVKKGQPNVLNKAATAASSGGASSSPATTPGMSEADIKKFKVKLSNQSMLHQSKIKNLLICMILG